MPVYTVEALGAVNLQLHAERLLPFGDFFNSISQREHVVNTASSLFRTLPVPVEAYGPQRVIGVSWFPLLGFLQG